MANTIREMLEEKGVSCWIAPRDVTPGEEYGMEIIRGIEDSKAFILILSEAANESSFVRGEVERAVSKGKSVFPVRVREVLPSKRLELFISSSHWINAWEPPLEEKVDQLASAIHSITGTELPATVPSTRKRLFALPKRWLRSYPIPTSAAATLLVLYIGWEVRYSIQEWEADRQAQARLANYRIEAEKREVILADQNRMFAEETQKIKGETEKLRKEQAEEAAIRAAWERNRGRVKGLALQGRSEEFIRELAAASGSNLTRCKSTLTADGGRGEEMVFWDVTLKGSDLGPHDKFIATALAAGVHVPGSSSRLKPDSTDAATGQHTWKHSIYFSFVDPPVR